MKHAYVDPEHFAIAQGMPLDDGVWLLSAVGVHRDFRGQGWGSAILRQVLEDADREGVTVLLSAQPDPGALTEAELIDWYSRHGFQVMDEGMGIEMRRIPVSRRTSE